MLISLLNIYLYVIPSIRLMNIYINASKFGRVHGVPDYKGAFPTRDFDVSLLVTNEMWLAYTSLSWMGQEMRWPDMRTSVW